MRFDYYHIRPCIEIAETVEGVETTALTSYANKAEFERVERQLNDASIPHESFWTVYGHYADTSGHMLACAMGDYISEADAFEVLDGILAPMRAALDLIGENTDKACAILQDAITLSTQRSAF